MAQPRFEHDCTNPGCCRFVGRTLRCDVYVYGSALAGPGIIMRSSSDGPDYRSYPTMGMARMVAERDAETFHAVHLAEMAS
jgi:hypothetical protein